jgi:hypothetical protein
MKYRTRIYYTEEQKTVMWDRWQKGDSLHAIARLFDRYHTSIQGIFSAAGGIRPARRTRSSLALSISEREEISRGIASDESMRSIATRLGRAASTISREIQRNGGDSKIDLGGLDRYASKCDRRLDSGCPSQGWCCGFEFRRYSQAPFRSLGGALFFAVYSLLGWY